MSEIRKNPISSIGKPQPVAASPKPTQKGPVPERYVFLERSIKVLKTTADGVQFVTQEGPTMVTSTTTLAQGLANIARLDPYGIFVGGAQVVSASLTLKDAWHRVFGRIDNLDQLLKNTEASVEAIRFCGELNMKEAESIQKNVAMLQRDYESLTARLKAIEAIADYGSKEIEARKRQIASKIQTVLINMDEVKQRFEEAQKEQLKAKADLTIGERVFNDMKTLANSKEGDIEALKQRVVQLQEMVQLGIDFCSKGIGHLTAAQAAMEAGFAGLVEIQEIQLNAFYELGALYAESRSIEREIKKQTQIDTETIPQKLEAIQGSAQKMIENIEDEFVMIGDIKENLQDIRMQMPGWTTGELIVALSIAALVPLGPGGKFMAASTFLQAWKNKENMREIIEGFFKAEYPQQEPQFKGVLTFSFDKKSTGWINRYYYGRPSATCGDLKIDLGKDQTFTCRVNFNNKGNSIGTDDLGELNKVMCKGLAEGSIEPQRCLNIIEGLHTQMVDRSEYGEVKGFITEECVYLNAAKRLAQEMKKS